MPLICISICGSRWLLPLQKVVEKRQCIVNSGLSLHSPRNFHQQSCLWSEHVQWVSEWMVVAHTHSVRVRMFTSQSRFVDTSSTHTLTHYSEPGWWGCFWCARVEMVCVCRERKSARSVPLNWRRSRGSLLSRWIRGSFRLKRTFVRVFQLPQRLDWEKGERKWQRDYSSINQKKESYQRCTFSIHFFTVFLFGTLNTGGNSLLSWRQCSIQIARRVPFGKRLPSKYWAWAIDYAHICWDAATVG